VRVSQHLALESPLSYEARSRIEIASPLSTLAQRSTEPFSTKVKGVHVLSEPKLWVEALQSLESIEYLLALLLSSLTLIKGHISPIYRTLEGQIRLFF
jgi:hypothetical protein